jgi:hypothetical protein
MAGPGSEPSQEIARPEHAAVRFDLIQGLLVHGAAGVAGKDEESAERALFGVQTFVEGTRWKMLAQHFSHPHQSTY